MSRMVSATDIGQGDSECYGHCHRNEQSNLHCDFRDAQTILSGLDSEVHAEPRRKGRSVRRIQLFRIPMLIHLQLGLSLHSLRVYIARTYSVLFLQSRKITDYYKHLDQNYNAYKIKVLGYGTNIGQEKIESIYNDFVKFLAFERKLISNSSLLHIPFSPATIEKVSSPVVNSPIIVTPFETVSQKAFKKVNKSSNQSSEKELKQAINFKRLRERLRYIEKNKSDIKSSAPKEESIGETLIKLIATQNKYYKMINGKLCLSVRTGLHIQDMISNCGCSLEKMPTMIEIVLKMLFGDVDERSIRSIVKATSTYSTSAERTAALVKRMSSSHFLVRDNASTILNSYLIMDATNKGNKSLVAKLFN